MRKAAELGKDLRREFIEYDPLELNVISRTQFWGIIANLPLGLTDQEVEEIFDNDLQFDNYGNVDYTHVLAKEMFIALERKQATNVTISLVVVQGISFFIREQSYDTVTISTLIACVLLAIIHMTWMSRS